MEDKTYKIGDRITFHIADGSKHYGRVEDIIPELGGGYILSVWCNALGKYLTIKQHDKPQK